VSELSLCWHYISWRQKSLEGTPEEESLEATSENRHRGNRHEFWDRLFLVGVGTDCCKLANFVYRLQEVVLLWSNRMVQFL